jgi:hypothetical protein
MAERIKINELRSALLKNYKMGKEYNHWIATQMELTVFLTCFMRMENSHTEFEVISLNSKFL